MNRVTMYRATIWPLGRFETDPEDVTVYENALGTVYGRLLDELEDFLRGEIDLLADLSDDPHLFDNQYRLTSRAYIRAAAQLAEACSEEAALSTARGRATFEPTSRSGPARTSSVPRMPSE